MRPLARYDFLVANFGVRLSIRRAASLALPVAELARVQTRSLASLLNFTPPRLSGWLIGFRTTEIPHDSGSAKANEPPGQARWGDFQRSLSPTAKLLRRFAAENCATSKLPDFEVAIFMSHEVAEEFSRG